MWDDFGTWLQSPGGARVLQTAIIPALAILVAGVLAALIARAAVRATIRRSERAEAGSAVGALVAAARIAADPDADRGSRRRAARLRAEADVRTRLLPLPGANVAADWAQARIDDVERRAGDGPVSTELDELRDRLIEWVARPKRAKRIFSAPSSGRRNADAHASRPAPVSEEPAAAPAHAPEQPPVVPVEQEHPAPGPRRMPPAPAQSEPTAPAAPAAASTAVPAAPASPATPLVGAAAAAAAVESVPAWQRTRAGERLQQERGRARGVEAPSTDDEPGSPGTAPVQLPHPHRAGTGSAPEQEDEAIPVDAHPQTRHGHAAEHAAAADAAKPAAAPVATATPAWLDEYDDEAQVTQNLDLKTPPPVSASSVRGRGTPGEDLVPRS
jgi:hypothetical protein